MAVQKEVAAAWAEVEGGLDMAVGGALVTVVAVGSRVELEVAAVVTEQLVGHSLCSLSQEGTDNRKPPSLGLHLGKFHQNSRLVQCKRLHMSTESKVVAEELQAGMVLRSG